MPEIKLIIKRFSGHSPLPFQKKKTKQNPPGQMVFHRLEESYQTFKEHLFHLKLFQKEREREGESAREKLAN